MAGFETLLREEITHLLDIDGDICHHAHNTTGGFLKLFGKVVEKLCSDVHTDIGCTVPICGLSWLTYVRCFRSHTTCHLVISSTGGCKS